MLRTRRARCAMRSLWIAPVVLGMFGSPVVAAGLEAGAAVADITPPTGFPMWGYAARHDKPSTGVLDPLKSRALLSLKVGDAKIALVSLDLGRAPTSRVHEADSRCARIGQVLPRSSWSHRTPIMGRSSNSTPGRAPRSPTPANWKRS